MTTSSLDDYVFPCPGNIFGMTLRDYFAGQAIGIGSPAPYNFTQEAADRVRAHRAYEIADAMLAERAKL
jgi:hypothetical protein